MPNEGEAATELWEGFSTRNGLSLGLALGPRVASLSASAASSPVDTALASNTQF